PPHSTPSPYTTLFRSLDVRQRIAIAVDDVHRGLELRQPVHDRLPLCDLRIGADAERERAFDALECEMRLDQRSERDRAGEIGRADRKSTRLNSSHVKI